ncbi:MAG: hypothetical protein V4543_11575 [Bacteroidota bacterium]
MLSPAVKRNYKISAFGISLLVHAGLLLLCWLFFKLTPPNPPLGDYGLAVNFGVDPAGFGDLQTMDPAGENKDPSKAETSAEQQTELSNPEPQPLDPKADEMANTVTGTEEAPAEVKPDAKPTKVKEKPVENPTPTKAPAAKPSVKEGNSNSSGGNNNNGDVKGAVGDMGHPEGSLDEKNNYKGKPGSGGASLDLTGWKWVDKPDPKEDSDAEGRIVFEIKVDGDGEIMGVRMLESTVKNPAVERLYKAEVEKLTFSKTKDNVTPADISTGKITFVIKNR